MKYSDSNPKSQENSATDFNQVKTEVEILSPE